MCLTKPGHTQEMQDGTLHLTQIQYQNRRENTFVAVISSFGVTSLIPHFRCAKLNTPEQGYDSINFE